MEEKLITFRYSRKGLLALFIFLLLFILSIFAEFIANDKPILIYTSKQFYMPIFQTYPETTFGGDFKTETDYRDPYVKNLIYDNGHGWIIWPIIPYSYKTINYNLPSPAPSPPTKDNWLGTDDQGRDILARSIYGFRISVLYGLALTIISSIIGIFAGAVQGYFGGKIDLWFQRIIEIWSGLPTLFILIILSSIIIPNIWWLLAIMILFSWTTLVGVVRAEFLKARNYDYVTAAKILGVTDRIIMFRHILPNAVVSTLTYLPFILTGAITTLTSLDFLGFGLPAGSPSLGELLAQGKANLHAPWIGITAFIILASMLSLLMFIGESIRDTFDPHYH